MDGIDSLNQRGQGIGIIQMGHGGVGVVGEAVYARLTQGNNGGSAPGNPAIVLQGVPGVDGGHAAVVNGRRFNAVFDIYISDAQGGKQMGILGIHSEIPPKSRLYRTALFFVNLGP